MGNSYYKWYCDGSAFKFGLFSIVALDYFHLYFHSRKPRTFTRLEIGIVVCLLGVMSQQSTNQQDVEEIYDRYKTQAAADVDQFAD